MKIDLHPVPKDPKSLAVYADINFRRIANSLGAMLTIAETSLTVTGSVTIDTGEPVVHNVVASLAEAPIANAAYVTAIVDPNNSSQIIVTVYKGDYTVSATATDVNIIIAAGEPANSLLRS